MKPTFFDTRFLYAIILLILLSPTAIAQCPGGVCPITSPSRPSFLGQQIDPAPYAAVSCRVQNTTSHGTQLGSGTAIDLGDNRSYVLTCHHLFREQVGNIRCQFTNGEAATAQVVATNPAHDLALLALDTPRDTQATLSDQSTTGSLTACGFGMNGRLRAIRGPLVGTANTTGATFPSLRVAATVMSGDSGGGLFDQHGQLCGVIWGVREGIAYATPREPINALIAPFRSHPRQNVDDPDDQPTPPFDAAAAWRSGVDTRLDQLASRIEDLRSAIPDPLAMPPPTDPLPQVENRLSEFRSQVFSEVRSRTIEMVREHIANIPAAWSLVQLATGGLSLASPIGIGLVAGAWLLRRRFTKSSSRAPSPGSAGASPSREASDREGDAPAELSTFANKPIAIDSPPITNTTPPETHYVPYETNSFPTAYQWASEQVARKFPGAVDTLATLDSLIKQQISGR